MQKTQDGIVSDTTRLRRTGNSMSIVVPKGILDAAGWYQGDLLLIQVRQNNVIIAPIEADLYQELQSNDNSIDTEN